MALANVTLSDTFDVWRGRTNQLIAVYDETNLLSRASYNATNVYVSTTANVTANLILSNTITMGIIYTNANTIIAANAANIIYSNNTIVTQFYNNANNIVNTYLTTNPISFAYNQANTARTVANTAYDKANSANIGATSGWSQANAAYTQANTVFGQANAAYTQANTVFGQANTARTHANTSFGAANASFGAANASFGAANASFLAANAAFARANVANTTAIAAFEKANTNVGTLITLQQDDIDVTRYIAFVNNTTGNASTINVSSTKLTFNPSSGILSATEFNSTSDKSQKTNIVEITNALEVIEQINGVQFNWIENGGNSYGVIAQELEQVLPDLVKETNGLKSVNYSGLIAFLIQAIKELNKKLESK